MSWLPGKQQQAGCPTARVSVMVPRLLLSVFFFLIQFFHIEILAKFDKKN
jgi:hypothetical protein